MKKIVFVALALVVIGMSSCKRCYDCKLTVNSDETTQICYGDRSYNAAKNGTITNDAGQDGVCY